MSHTLTLQPNEVFQAAVTVTPTTGSGNAALLTAINASDDNYVNQSAGADTTGIIFNLNDEDFPEDAAITAIVVSLIDWSFTTTTTSARKLQILLDSGGITIGTWDVASHSSSTTTADTGTTTHTFSGLSAVNSDITTVKIKKTGTLCSWFVDALSIEAAYYLPIVPGVASLTSYTGTSAVIAWTAASEGSSTPTAQLQKKLATEDGTAWADVAAQTSSPGTAGSLSSALRYDLRVKFTDDALNEDFSNTVTVGPPIGGRMGLGLGIGL